MVKATGMVRRVDELGRVVLPIELRRTLGIEEKDSLEIYVDADVVILRKYEPACVFCGNAERINQFKGKNVCESCRVLLSSDGTESAGSGGNGGTRAAWPVVMPPQPRNGR